MEYCSHFIVEYGVYIYGVLLNMEYVQIHIYIYEFEESGIYGIVWSMERFKLSKVESMSHS